MLRTFLSFVFIALLLAAGPATAARESVDYLLGTGDKLRITVFNQEDLSGEFVVDDTGVISMPLIGNIKVASLSIRAAERMMVDALSPEYLVNPKVSIQVLNYRPFYIIGEVNDPGSYPFVNGMTVTEAVALAGGYTYRAKEKEVLIVRGNDASRTEEPATETTPILPGDVIKIPERFF